jgi:dipeptidase D
MSIEHPKTKDVLAWFEEIAKIPRCSKNEDAIFNWLKDWAKEHDFPVRTDTVNNIVIQVPASPGYEDAPILTLQGHMDMVCEKAKGHDFDFSKDPIELVYDGEWLRANKTTLGADNGIAIAMAMAAAMDKDNPHPPLELLFTVDEETGLTGASELGTDMLEGRILLNIDSEDEGVFTVGCAGGKDTHLSVPVASEAVPGGYATLKLVAGGMSGGHSGVDIHEQRANAIHLLARGLDRLLADGELRLVELTGGTAHNAIPRDAEAVIALPADRVSAAKEAMQTLQGHAKQEFAKTDPNLTLELEDAEGAKHGLALDDTRRAVDFLLAVPHGVAEMSQDIAGLVETSDNLATVKLDDGRVKVLTSQRSSNMQRLALLTLRIEAVGRLAGGEAESGEGYPAWEPNMDSKLLAKCVGVYKELFDKEPVVEAIHAGLECGIIGAKYDGMDMISFGPTIKNPHSPTECLELATVGMVYDFMTALFKSFK